MAFHKTLPYCCHFSWQAAWQLQSSQPSLNPTPNRTKIPKSPKTLGLTSPPPTTSPQNRNSSTATPNRCQNGKFALSFSFEGEMGRGPLRKKTWTVVEGGNDGCHDAHDLSTRLAKFDHKPRREARLLELWHSFAARNRIGYLQNNFPLPPVQACSSVRHEFEIPTRAAPRTTSLPQVRIEGNRSTIMGATDSLDSRGHMEHLKYMSRGIG